MQSDKMKRYKLKKDLPDLKASPEVVFERVGDITMPTHRDYSYSTPSRRYWYPIEVVENSPEWFEPVPVSDEGVGRIEVSELGWSGLGRKGILFNCQISKPVSEDKFPAIKRAIEAVLNDDAKEYWNIFDKVMGKGKSFTEKEAIDFLTLNGYTATKVEPNASTMNLYHPYKYTQQEMDAARTEAFWAARERADDHIGTIRFHDDGAGMYYYPAKFTTFNDYINNNTFKGLSSKQSPSMPENEDEYVWPENERAEFIRFVEEENTSLGWLVESVKDKSGKIWQHEYWKNRVDSAPNHGFYGNSYGYFLSTKLREPFWSINSVKRLSDGVVFTVDDEVYDYRAKITGFAIVDGELMTDTKHGEKHSRIPAFWLLKKPSSTPEQAPFNWVVFTEDGFGFPTWKKKDWRGDRGSNWDDTVKTFLTRTECEEYILNNKPCLSVSDIMNQYAGKGWGMNQSYKEDLTNLAKYKQQ